MNRYRPNLSAGGMHLSGDGEWVIASEAEESFLRAKAEGFEECERLRDGDYRQELL